jgi:hypothetical protein
MFLGYEGETYISMTAATSPINAHSCRARRAASDRQGARRGHRRTTPQRDELRPSHADDEVAGAGENRAVAKVLDSFLRICGQNSTSVCAFSAGSPAATSAKWNALLARLQRAPINLGGPFTYADLLNVASADLDLVQPYTTPVTGGDFPGWSGMAQGLEQLWLARNQKLSTADPAAPTDVTSARQQYSRAEQAYAVICDDSPSPRASAYSHLQHLVTAGGSVIGLPHLREQDEPCATWPVHGVNTYSGPGTPTRAPSS